MASGLMDMPDDVRLAGEPILVTWTLPEWQKEVTKATNEVFPEKQAETEAFYRGLMRRLPGDYAQPIKAMDMPENIEYKGTGGARGMWYPRRGLMSISRNQTYEDFLKAVLHETSHSAETQYGMAVDEERVNQAADLLYGYGTGSFGSGAGGVKGLGLLRR